MTLVFIVTFMSGIDSSLTVVAKLEGEEHPFKSVMITENVPSESTVIDCVVSPFDQRYVLPIVELKVTIPPSQNVVGPFELIIGAAGAPGAERLMFNGNDVQVFTSVNINVYNPCPKLDILAGRSKVRSEEIRRSECHDC